LLFCTIIAITFVQCQNEASSLRLNGWYDCGATFENSPPKGDDESKYIFGNERKKFS
jgi:hypothetical protein